MVNTFGYKKIKSIEIMNLSEDGSLMQLMPYTAKTVSKQAKLG